MQLLETIKCLNGKLHNLEFHQKRFNRARLHHFPGAVPISLKHSINIPEHAASGLFRCRVLYSITIEKIEFLPHEIRKVQSLRLVEQDDINYPYKYSDRKELEQLYQGRGDCDDILKIKNGFVTDTYTANPVFCDGSTWWAPETTLLEGTQRTRLILEGKLKLCSIRAEDLGKYRKVGLVNALQDMDDMPVVDIRNIR